MNCIYLSCWVLQEGYDIVPGVCSLSALLYRKILFQSIWHHTLKTTSHDTCITVNVHYFVYAWNKLHGFHVILCFELPAPCWGRGRNGPLIVSSNTSKTNKASNVKLSTTLRASILHPPAKFRGFSSNGVTGKTSEWRRVPPILTKIMFCENCCGSYSFENSTKKWRWENDAQEIELKNWYVGFLKVLFYSQK